MRKNSMKKLVIGCSLAMACSLVGGIALTNSLVQADAADLTTNEDFKMVAGAAIRYDEQKHGLRFAAEIGGEEDLVDNANYYMLIVPERYFTNLNVSVADTTNYYVELKTKLEAISEDAAASLINLACKPFEATETTENFTAGNYYVYGTVSNVLFNNSNENFFGISYYTTGEGETLTYTYANVANAGDNVRNITYIASRAYETNDYEGDTQKKAILEGYIYNGINKHLGQAQGTALDINQLTLDQSTLTLGKGTSSKITVSVLPSTIPMTFRSGNESIAKVAADGTVTAVGVGSTNITVSMLGVERTCAVTVEEVYANYQTKIYAQDGTGEYVLISSNEDEGIVGETVAIENYATIPTVDLPLTQEYSGGYVFNADKSNVSGEVAGDGSLVLKAYYDTAFRYKNIPSSNDNIVKNGNTYTMNNGFLYQSGPMYQMFGTYSDCAVITVEITAPVATILGERGASGLDRTVGILAATNDMVPAGTAWSGETAPAGYLRSVGFYPHTKGAGISWNGLPFCYAADHPNSDLQHPLNKPVDGVIQSGWQPFAYTSNGSGYTVTDDTVELTIVLYNNRFYIFVDDAFCTSKGFNDYAVADSAGDTNQVFEDGDKFVFGVWMTQTIGYDYTITVTEEAYDANATALLNSEKLYQSKVLGLDPSYTTEIYAQDGTGEYVLLSSETKEGVIGETVEMSDYTVAPTANLPLTQEYSGGYTFNASKSNVSGEVKGDGSLVLAAYYDTTFRYKNIPSSNDNIVKNGNTYTMNNGFLYQSGPMYQMFGTYSDCAVITVEITAPVETILNERGAGGLDRLVGIMAATNETVPAGTAWSGETAPAGYLRSVGFYPHTKGAGISWNGLPFCYAADHPNSDLQHPLNKPVDGVVQSGWQPFAYTSNGSGYTVTDDTVELTIVLYNNRFYIFVDDAFCTSKGFNDYAVADSAGDTNQIFEDGDKFVFGVFMTQTVGYDYTFKVTEEAYDANATALLNSVELYATNVLGLTNTASVSTMSVVSTMPAVPVSRKEYL